MNLTTKLLHESLIRCIRGVIDAWEKWVKAQK